jgi:hypothetical protein
MKMNSNIQENLRLLNYYLELSFTNLYSCCVKGAGFDFYGYSKKIGYKLRNSVKELAILIENEDLQEVKSFFTQEVKLLEDTIENNRYKFKKDEYKRAMFWNIYVVELLYFDKIIREIDKALSEKKRLDFAAIEEDFISTYKDFDWDFRKTLAKTGKYYPGKAVTPRLRKKKNKQVVISIQI